ncbi:MAG: hypothetical protein R3C18_22850 [Planctomycetaceae bacterium]
MTFHPAPNYQPSYAVAGSAGIIGFVFNAAASFVKLVFFLVALFVGGVVAVGVIAAFLDTPEGQEMWAELTQEVEQQNYSSSYDGDYASTATSREEMFRTSSYDTPSIGVGNRETGGVVGSGDYRDVYRETVSDFSGGYDSGSRLQYDRYNDSYNNYRGR